MATKRDRENEQAPQGDEQELTLTEFCTRLSAADRRVELIGGFNASEAQAGKVKDTETRFRARYTEFVNKPV